jgi:hypothetical protein
MPLEHYVQSRHGSSALIYIEQARRYIQTGVDAIPALEAALACLRIEAGEQPPDPDLIEFATDLADELPP